MKPPEQLPQFDRGSDTDYLERAYASLKAGFRQRASRMKTERVLYAVPGMWTPFGTMPEEIHMTAAFCPLKPGGQVAFAYKERKIFRWDITDPEFVLSHRTPDNTGVDFLIKISDSEIFCVHRTARDGKYTGGWEKTAGNPPMMIKLDWILHALDRVLPAAA